MPRRRKRKQMTVKERRSRYLWKAYRRAWGRLSGAQQEKLNAMGWQGRRGMLRGIDNKCAKEHRRKRRLYKAIRKRMPWDLHNYIWSFVE